jgi:3'(2'), 5'-bisphosphate nucleotidase
MQLPRAHSLIAHQCRRSNEPQMSQQVAPPGLDKALLDELSSVASAACAAILRTCAGGLMPRTKSDATPVTAADHAAEAVILEGLRPILPGITVVSEEAAATACPASLSDPFILVDPLDGTRELLAGREEYTVNIAIISGGSPRLGIIAAPARGLLWRGIEGQGAERLRLDPGEPVGASRAKTTIHARALPSSGLVAAVSRSHLDARTEALLNRLPIRHRITCGSAVKFCQIAEGLVDCYPRLSGTCEWDVAAGHAIVAAAGGRVTTPEGRGLAYGRIGPAFRIPGFIAWGDPSGPEMLERLIGRPGAG